MLSPRQQGTGQYPFPTRNKFFTAPQEPTTLDFLRLPSFVAGVVNGFLMAAKGSAFLFLAELVTHRNFKESRVQRGL
jgi:hypothetical protein